MKTVMRHFVAKANQGRDQPVALLQLLRWDGLAPIQCLSAGQADEGQEFGAHSLVRKEQSMDVGRDQMEDPML